MNCTRLFKNRTAVVQIVFTAAAIILSLGLATDASAQRAAQNSTINAGVQSAGSGLTLYDPGKAQRDALDAWEKAGCEAKPYDKKCQILENQAGGGSSLPNRCKDAVSAWQKTNSEYRMACAKAGAGGAACLEKAAKCETEQLSKGTTQSLAQGFDSSDCSSLLSSRHCPSLNGGSKDYKQEEESLNDRLKDSQNSMMDLQEKLQEIQMEGEEKMQKLKEDQLKQQRDFRDAEEKYLEDYKSAIAGLNAEKAKAIEDGEKAILGIESEIMSMRAQLRAANSSIASARDGLYVTCRAVAARKFKEAEDEYKKKIQQERSGPRNYNQSALAGSDKRKAKLLAKNKQADYLAAFQECMNGESPEGADAIKKIKDSERAKVEAEAFIADKTILIETQREMIKKKIFEVSKQASEQEQQLTQTLQQRITNLRTDYTTNQQMMSEAYQLEQKRMANQMMMTNQRMTNEQSRLNDLNNKLLLNSRTMMCHKMSGGSSSEDRASKQLDGLSEVSMIRLEVEQACEEVGQACEKDSSSSGSTTAKNSCKSFKRNNDRANEFLDDADADR